MNIGYAFPDCVRIPYIMATAEVAMGLLKRIPGRGIEATRWPSIIYGERSAPDRRHPEGNAYT